MVLLINRYELIWSAPGDIGPEREQDLIQSPKLMLIPSEARPGLHVMKAVPKGWTEILMAILD
jgi:hypothetical protein